MPTTPLDELRLLLDGALGADQGLELPDDARAFDAACVRGWPDVAAVLAAYPGGVPRAAREALLAVCKQLTRAGRPAPELTTAVARLPALGGHTTRDALGVVGRVPRKRTGLTRDSRGASLSPRTGAGQRPGPTTTTSPRPPTRERLRQLETIANRLQATLDAEAEGSPRRPALLGQARHAWVALQAGLAARREALAATGSPASTIGGYRAAEEKIAALIARLPRAP